MRRKDDAKEGCEAWEVMKEGRKEGRKDVKEGRKRRKERCEGMQEGCEGRM